MQTYIVNNWDAIFGLIIGVMSLIVGILALKQATDAAKNAKNASEQVQEVRKDLAKKTLADELGHIRQLIEPVIIFLNAGASQGAAALIRPAQYAISHSISRWDTVLSEKQKECLIKSRVQLDSASTVLLRNNTDIKSLSSCIKATDKAVHLIIEAQGLVLAEADQLSQGE